LIGQGHGSAVGRRLGGVGYFYFVEMKKARSFSSSMKGGANTGQLTRALRPGAYRTRCFFAPKVQLRLGRGGGCGRHTRPVFTWGPADRAEVEFSPAVHRPPETFKARARSRKKRREERGAADHHYMTNRAFQAQDLPGPHGARTATLDLARKNILSGFTSAGNLYKPHLTSRPPRRPPRCPVTPGGPGFARRPALDQRAAPGTRRDKVAVKSALAGLRTWVEPRPS